MTKWDAIEANTELIIRQAEGSAKMAHLVHMLVKELNDLKFRVAELEKQKAEGIYNV